MGGKHFEGMRVECNHCRLAVEFLSQLLYSLEKRLMTLMDTVEVADCDCRVLEFALDGLDSVKNLHAVETPSGKYLKRLDGQRLLKYNIAVVISSNLPKWRNW